jgi:hypothetical protein
VDSQDVAGDSTTASKVKTLFMAERAEVLMAVAGNWNAGDSSGEGLSQFASILRFQTGHYNYYSNSTRWFFRAGSRDRSGLFWRKRPDVAQCRPVGLG